MERGLKENNDEIRKTMRRKKTMTTKKTMRTMKTMMIRTGNKPANYTCFSVGFIN